MPTQYEAEFKRTIAQMNDLMARDPAPVSVAAAATPATPPTTN